MRVKTIINALSSLLLMLCAQTSYASAAQASLEWKNWSMVGQAQLSVLFFDVYQSRLLTPNGVYQSSDDLSPHPLALAIDYQRDISSQQLLEATDEQWEKLGYQTPMRKQWLVQLKSIFPDIKKGQQLAYVTDGQTGQFYYQHKGQVDAIGTISDETLNDAFLAIWLSPNTQYPKLRKQLIGVK